MAALLTHDPVVEHYRAFFALFDWSLVDDFQAQRSPRGRPAHPESAYLKVFLIRQCEGFMYTSHLHRFLLKHPLLVIELGFHLVLDPTQPYGFDVARTVPSASWLREQLRSLDPALLQSLLQGIVTALHAEIPGLGETVAFDVKHIRPTNFTLSARRLTISVRMARKRDYYCYYTTPPYKGQSPEPSLDCHSNQLSDIHNWWLGLTAYR